MNLQSEWRALRELDWRELDLKEAGTWPLSLQMFCGVATFLLVLWGAQWYLATPKQEALERVQREQQQLLEQFEMKAFQAANLGEMRTQMTELEARMDSLLEMLPTGAEVPALLDDISEAALEQHLVIDFIRLKAPVVREFYIEQPFDIQVQGDYHRIAAFVSTVAGLSRIVTLHDFSLTPVADGTLRLSMLAKTYSYRDEPSAKEAP
ncbi:type IV pilus inner membrane component PilO [Halomonas sp. WWR20]